VELFREVAERDGFIVAGSNNSRNGSGVPLQKILTTLWDDTHARLSLDARRTYAAGFSGGARVACAFAYLYENRVAGVIGCGASFPANIRPSRSTPFAFYGIVGVDDFNYFELKDLDRALEDFGIAHRVQTLAGGHDWPPASACAEAVEWMELQERKRAGGAQRDEKSVEEFFKRELERARAAEESGQMFEAYLGYVALAADFRGLRDVSEFEKKAALLRDSKEVRRAVRDEQEQKERQRVLDENLERLINAPVDAADPTASRTEFRDLVSDLLKASAGQKDSSERRVARRVLAGAYVGLSQEASEAYRLKDYKLAALKMETAAELRPEDPNVFLILARLYTLRGDRKSALAGLYLAATAQPDIKFEVQH
jgi:hypothetical protein